MGVQILQQDPLLRSGDPYRQFLRKPAAAASTLHPRGSEFSASPCLDFLH